MVFKEVVESEVRIINVDVMPKLNIQFVMDEYFD
jgi:hypothetical protein